MIHAGLTSIIYLPICILSDIYKMRKIFTVTKLIRICSVPSQIRSAFSSVHPSCTRFFITHSDRNNRNNTILNYTCINFAVIALKNGQHLIRFHNLLILFLLYIKADQSVRSVCRLIPLVYKHVVTNDSIGEKASRIEFNFADLRSVPII